MEKISTSARFSKNFFFATGILSSLAWFKMALAPLPVEPTSRICLAAVGLIFLSVTLVVFMKYTRPLVDVWRNETDQSIFFEKHGVRTRIPYNQIRNVERVEFLPQIVVTFFDEKYRAITVMFTPALRFRSGLPKEIVFGK